MPLYLCVDCGGSKTSVVLTDRTGNPVARALGGPSNFAYLGLAPFIAVVQESVEKALRACDPDILDAELHKDGAAPTGRALTLPPPENHPFFAAAWLGVSGCDSPAAIATLTPPLEKLLGIRPRVANDTHLLAAPMKLYPEVNGAIAAVAGTGGIVVSFGDAVKSASGGDVVGLEELGRVGGWGWILGDEGGGFHVGREAIRQVLEQADRASVKKKPEVNEAGDVTKIWGLKERLLHRFQVTDVFELLTVVHLPDPAHGSSLDTTPNVGPDYVLMPREKRLSSLSPLVFTAAFEDHDPLALNVLKTTSGALVDQICILLKGENEITEDRTIRASDSILCLGGSLSGLDTYRGLLLDELKRRGHVFCRVEVIDDAAAVGAKALAVSTGP
ncbi:uncharacterized protein FIBRA_05029 [Fibroporia radiculosa]|uniref:N-acetyl-D-glucosamine kinase n=1 Tax=Fibroporia radiculosa TaxID=599839 RepID=J4GQA0_9APHY|nr:uncharacterized protein FIBRA_05029 [Fibroporia radiculosa]CCM02915.1 predicted protein [Fibroporia radiculosa]